MHCGCTYCPRVQPNVPLWRLSYAKLTRVGNVTHGRKPGLRLTNVSMYKRANRKRERERERERELSRKRPVYLARLLLDANGSFDGV